MFQPAPSHSKSAHSWWHPMPWFHILTAWNRASIPQSSPPHFGSPSSCQTSRIKISGSRGMATVQLCHMVWMQNLCCNQFFSLLLFFASYDLNSCCWEKVGAAWPCAKRSLSCGSPNQHPWVQASNFLWVLSPRGTGSSHGAPTLVFQCPLSIIVSHYKPLLTTIDHYWPL